MTWLLALAACAAAAPAARADAIDKGLLERGGELVAFCKARKLRCVGVLRFRVVFGQARPSYAVDPLCGGLATRVENLMVLMLPTDGAWVLRAAGDQAQARNVNATQATALGREKLFQGKYTLAWKAEKASADAFLTGEARFASDLSTVTVLVEAFLKGNPAKLVRVVEFTVPVDRDALCDAGLAFRLPASRVKKASATELDRLAVASALGLRARQSSRGGSVQVEPVAGGSVRLKNLADQRVGLVLRFAGLNSIDQQVDVAARCRRWLLGEKQSYVIKGFYSSAGGATRQVMPFKSGRRGASDLSTASEGFLEAQVLLDGGEGAAGTSPSLRGLTAEERSRCKGREALRVALSKRAALKPADWDVDRGADLDGGGKASGSSLRNPTLIEYRRFGRMKDEG